MRKGLTDYQVRRLTRFNLIGQFVFDANAKGFSIVQAIDAACAGFNVSERTAYNAWWWWWWSRPSPTEIEADKRRARKLVYSAWLEVFNDFLQPK